MKLITKSKKFCSRIDEFFEFDEFIFVKPSKKNSLKNKEKYTLKLIEFIFTLVNEVDLLLKGYFHKYFFDKFLYQNQFTFKKITQKSFDKFLFRLKFYLKTQLLLSKKILLQNVLNS